MLPDILGSAVLVVAHPGHELTLAGWLARARPTVFVMTDGSGQLGRPRLQSTTKVLRDAGARPGSIYGQRSDRDVYTAMLSRDAGVFVRMAFTLADRLVADAVDYVVGDAGEGYNPTHDVCRIIVGGAVELATRRGGRRIGNYEYVVAGSREACLTGRCGGTIRMRLDDEALARKVAAALAYPELRGEVEAAIGRSGIEGFRHECLHPVGNRTSWTPTGGGRPHYEEHGLQRVTSGKYERLLRYSEHIAPLHAALWGAIERALPSPAAPRAVGAPSLEPVGGDARHS